MSGHKTKINLIVVLGQTASGKTRLGVQLAERLNGEIISADARQVYKELDIGAGKDLDAYQLEHKRIPYHLIDIVSLDQEFSVYHFQKAFYQVFQDCRKRGVWPLMVGGTGLYLEAVLLNYAMPEVPPNPALRSELSQMTEKELIQRLQTAKTNLHNTSDLAGRERIIRAIEIAGHPQTVGAAPRSCLSPLVLGVEWEREVLKQRIAKRLEARLKSGLIEEVERIHALGVSWERLRSLGLEYRYVADFLLGNIKSWEDLRQNLYTAICRFAKRQATWFRRMERRGVKINWVGNAQLELAWNVIETNLKQS